MTTPAIEYTMRVVSITETVMGDSERVTVGFTEHRDNPDDYVEGTRQGFNLTLLKTEADSFFPGDKFTMSLTPTE